jgi:hypothetical protein
VLPAEFGEVGAAGVVAILQKIQGLLQPTGAEVDGEHRLHVGLGGPAHEFAQSELVTLDSSPSGIEARGPLLDRTHAVLPPVSGNEVAARVAHHCHAQLAHEFQHIGAEAVGVGAGMIRFVDARIHAAAHMLDERAEETGTDRSGDEAGIED